MSSCTRGLSLKYMLHSALQQCSRVAGVPHINSVVLHPPGVRQFSAGATTVLHELGEAGTGRSEVKVTLADNPAIIVCHHPPNKIVKRLTRPVHVESAVKESITSEQEAVALTLLQANPLVWSCEAVAELFNVSIQSVIEMQIPEDVSEKQKVSRAVLQSWTIPDQTAFKSLMKVSRYEARNKLLAERPTSSSSVGSVERRN